MSKKVGKWVVPILVVLSLFFVWTVDTGQSDNYHAKKSTATKIVTDMSGKKVRIPKKVERIADLWHANNQVILLLGGQKKLVATTQVIKQQAWFKLIYPEIAKVTAPFSGQTLQVEELLKTKPDVVIAADANQIKQARNAKLPTVDAMYQSFTGLRQSINLTAKVLGGQAPKIAKEYQRDLTANLAYVKKHLHGVKKRPKVLHIASPSNLNQVDGRKTIVDQWIKAAGGRNALTKTGNLISVTTEELVKANPDIIIVGDATTAQARKALQSNSALNKLAAVKANHVYGNPQGTFPWDRYSAEEALQVLWAAKKLHPTKFKQLNLVKKTKSFYYKYYGFTLSNKQARDILAGKEPTS